MALGSAVHMSGEQGQISGFVCASVCFLDTGSDDTVDFLLPGVFWSVWAARSLAMSHICILHSTQFLRFVLAL